jgi:hypothetical protein
VFVIDPSEQVMEFSFLKGNYWWNKKPLP